MSTPFPLTRTLSLGLVLTGMLLLAPAVVTSASASPGMDWQSVIESPGHYVLTESVRLDPARGTRNPAVTLRKGSGLTLEKVEGLDGLDVSLLTFERDHCVSDATVPETDLTLIVPTGTPADSHAEVGAQLTAKCTLSIYVEVKDYARASFFAPR